MLDDGSVAPADQKIAEGFFRSRLGFDVKKGTWKNTGVEMTGRCCG